MPKKDPVKIVQYHEHVEILKINGEMLFFFLRQREGPFYPTLRLFHKYPFILPQLPSLSIIQPQFIFSTILYQCQMYRKVSRKPCTGYSGPHTAPNNYLVLYPPILTLSTLFPMMQSVSLWLFCSYKFALHSPFTFARVESSKYWPNLALCN